MMIVRQIIYYNYVIKYGNIEKLQHQHCLEPTF